MAKTLWLAPPTHHLRQVCDGHLLGNSRTHSAANAQRAQDLGKHCRVAAGLAHSAQGGREAGAHAKQAQRIACMDESETGTDC